MLGVPFSDQEYVQRHTNAFIAPADPEYGGSVEAMVAASNAIEEYAEGARPAEAGQPDRRRHVGDRELRGPR